MDVTEIETTTTTEVMGALMSAVAGVAACGEMENRDGAIAHLCWALELAGDLALKLALGEPYPEVPPVPDGLRAEALARVTDMF